MFVNRHPKPVHVLCFLFTGSQLGVGLHHFGLEIVDETDFVIKKAWGADPRVGNMTYKTTFRVEVVAATNETWKNCTAAVVCRGHCVVSKGPPCVKAVVCEGSCRSVMSTVWDGSCLMSPLTTAPTRVLWCVRKQHTAHYISNIQHKASLPSE